MPLAANAAHGSVAACRPRLHQHLGLAAHSGHALAGPAAVPRPHNQRARSRRSTHHHATSQTVASPGTQPQAPHPLLTHGAPPEYDFRALTQPPSKAYVAQHWPELADLAEDGGSGPRLRKHANSCFGPASRLCLAVTRCHANTCNRAACYEMWVQAPWWCGSGPQTMRTGGQQRATRNLW